MKFTATFDPQSNMTRYEVFDDAGVKVDGVSIGVDYGGAMGVLWKFWAKYGTGPFECSPLADSPTVAAWKAREQAAAFKALLDLEGDGDSPRKGRRR